MTRQTTDHRACPVCGQGFVERTELERHAETEHDVLGDFLDG